MSKEEKKAAESQGKPGRRSVKIETERSDHIVGGYLSSEPSDQAAGK
jgi:hypothetical protein